MPTNNLSVPGIVGIAILVILVLAIIVRNIYVCSSPVPMWWSGWVPSTPCGAWACI